MKTTHALFCLMTAGAFSASAATVLLENGGKEKLTTGDALDKIKNTAVTAKVVEIPGLLITAQTAAETLEVNALSESFGVIDKTNPADDRGRFEGDEMVTLSFDQTVRISGIDFNHFDQDESFTLQIGETTQVITYAALSNKSTDRFACDYTVPAGAAIRLSTGSKDSVIGLDALEMEVSATDGSAVTAQPDDAPDKKDLLSSLLNRD